MRCISELLGNAFVDVVNDDGSGLAIYTDLSAEHPMNAPLEILEMELGMCTDSRFVQFWKAQTPMSVMP